MVKLSNTGKCYLVGAYAAARQAIIYACDEALMKQNILDILYMSTFGQRRCKMLFQHVRIVYENIFSKWHSKRYPSFS